MALAQGAQSLCGGYYKVHAGEVALAQGAQSLCGGYYKVRSGLGTGAQSLCGGYYKVRSGLGTGGSESVWGVLQGKKWPWHRGLRVCVGGTTR